MLLRLLIALFIMEPLTAQAATNEWRIESSSQHPYWQKSACWGFIDGQNDPATSLQVYADQENQMGRPLLQVITSADTPIYEATLFFNEDPEGQRYELLPIARAGQTGQLLLTLPLAPGEENAPAFFALIKEATAQVEFRNEMGVVKRVQFSLSKSAASVRFVLDNCFIHLSRPFKNL